RQIRRARRRRIAALALEHVRPVDAGRRHLDQHFACLGLRHRPLRQLEDFRRTEFGDFDRFHLRQLQEWIALPTRYPSAASRLARPFESATQSILHEKRPARITQPAVCPLPHYCGFGSPCGASFSNAFADRRTRPFSSVWMTLTFTCWPSFR